MDFNLTDEQTMLKDTVQRYLANVGGTTYPSGSPAEFDAQVRRDIASEKAIIKRLGIVKE